MKNKKTIIKITAYLLVGLLFTTLTSADKIDSLKKVIETADHDTTRIKALNQLGWKVMYSNPDTAIILSKQALYLSEKTEDQKNKAKTLNNLGVYYWIKSDYPTALNYHFKALEIREKQNNLKGMARS